MRMPNFVRRLLSRTGRRRERYGSPKIESFYFNELDLMRNDKPEIRTDPRKKVVLKAYHITPEVLERINRLVRARVPVEEPFHQKSKTETTGMHTERIVVFEYAGETLYDLLRRNEISNQEWEEISRQTAIAIGKMHSAGVSHNDIGSNNLTVKRDRKKLQVRILDLDLSKDVKVNWDNVEDIHKKFGLDYASYLYVSGVKKLERNPIDYLKMMIAQYPCSERVREELIEHLIKYYKAREVKVA